MGLPASSTLSARRRPFACQPNDLAIHPDRRSALGAGTVYTKVLVVVYSPYPCTLAGVPAVAALGRGGRVVEAARPVPDLRPARRRHGRVVTLEGGHPALFFIAHRDTTGSSRCRSASTHTLRVRLPGARRRTVVAYPMSYCAAQSGELGLKVGRIE